MKFYIAGRWLERKFIKTIMTHIEKMGHTVTHDWTIEGEDVGYDPAELAVNAVEDIEGVKACDVLIAITINEHHYRGTYGEIVGALILDKPVWMVGQAPSTNKFVFKFHPNVTQIKSLRSLYRKVKLCGTQL